MVWSFFFLPGARTELFIFSYKCKGKTPSRVSSSLNEHGKHKPYYPLEIEIFRPVLHQKV